MGIKFRCHACDKKLHVKAFLAGKRGVCPKCGAKVRIPLASTETPRATADQLNGRHKPLGGASSPHLAPRDSEASVAEQETVRAGSPAVASHASAGSGIRRTTMYDPIAESPEAVWYVRPPTGGQFGPADGTIMRRWLNEGRVSADALVWREGWPDWKPAGPVFPSVESPTDLLATVAAVEAAATDEDDAFAFAEQRPTPTRNSLRPRSQPWGRHVMIIGVLGVLCVALLVALVAIVLRTRG
jgi:hypothetical protein